jgi:hypothetical protein
MTKNTVIMAGSTILTLSGGGVAAALIPLAPFVAYGRFVSAPQKTIVPDVDFAGLRSIHQ